MKILIFSQYYYPEQFQINEIAPALAARGHDVTVVCGTPNYPKGKVYSGYENGLRSDETVSNVRVLRVRHKPRGSNQLSLIRNYISFVNAANEYITKLDNDYDVIFGYQLSPVTSMLPAIRFAKKNNIPLLLYVLDIWPESGRGHLPIKNGLIYKLLKRISKKIYNSADRLLVTSRPFIKYLSLVNRVPPQKIGYLPQHADSSLLSKNLSHTTTSTVNFMFAGNIGAGASLDVVIKAASKIDRKSEFKIHLVGDGSQRKRLETIVRELNLNENIIFHGNKARAEMPAYYQMADVLLITLRGNNEVGNTMPGKLQMYMTAGKPILGAINGAAREVITESGCGRCVPAGDVDGLAQIMTDYITTREAYSECGDNARRYFMKYFTLEKFISSLEIELQRLCDK